MACGGELFIWSANKAECTVCAKPDRVTQDQSVITVEDTKTGSLPIPAKENC